MKNKKPIETPVENKVDSLFSDFRAQALENKKTNPKVKNVNKTKNRTYVELVDNSLTTYETSWFENDFQTKPNKKTKVPKQSPKTYNNPPGWDAWAEEYKKGPVTFEIWHDNYNKANQAKKELGAVGNIQTLIDNKDLDILSDLPKNPKLEKIDYKPRPSARRIQYYSRKPTPKPPKFNYGKLVKPGLVGAGAAVGAWFAYFTYKNISQGPRSKNRSIYRPY